MGEGDHSHRSRQRQPIGYRRQRCRGRPCRDDQSPRDYFNVSNSHVSLSVEIPDMARTCCQRMLETAVSFAAQNKTTKRRAEEWGGGVPTLPRHVGGEVLS